MTTDAYKNQIDATVSKNVRRLESGRGSQYARRTKHVRGHGQIARLGELVAAAEGAAAQG